MNLPASASGTFKLGSKAYTTGRQIRERALCGLTHSTHLRQPRYITMRPGCQAKPGRAHPAINDFWLSDASGLAVGSNV